MGIFSCLPRDEKLYALGYARPTVNRLARQLRRGAARRGVAWLLATRALRLSEMCAWVDHPDSDWNRPLWFIELLVEDGAPIDALAAVRAGYPVTKEVLCRLGQLAFENKYPIEMLRTLRQALVPPSEAEHSHAFIEYVEVGKNRLRVLVTELKQWGFTPLAYKTSKKRVRVEVRIGALHRSTFRYCIPQGWTPL